MSRARKQQSPKRTAAVKALGEALQELMDRAGLTDKVVRRRLQSPTCPDEPMSAQLFADNMRIRLSGPVDAVIIGVVEAAAEALGEPAGQLYETITPLVHQIKGRRTVFQPPTASAVETIDTHTPVAVERSAPAVSDRAPSDVAPQTELQEQILREGVQWLTALLCDAEERRAAAELKVVFGHDELIARALVEIGAADPGAVALLLEAIRIQPGQGLSRSTALLSAITTLDARVAQRVALVPLPRATTPPAPALDPQQMFSRRMAAMLRRGDFDQPSREVAASLHDEVLDRHADSVLAGIITSGIDGPMLTAQLLEQMRIQHPQEMFACFRRLLQRTEATGHDELLDNLDRAMSADLRITLLSMLAHRSELPETFDRTDPGVRILATYLRSACANMFRTVTTQGGAPQLLMPDINVGYLIDSMPDLGSSLSLLAGGHIKDTAYLLARAVQDWDDCLAVAERSAPVMHLAETVLDMPAGPQLTGELLRTHPQSGALLFNAMIILDHPRFHTLLATLVGNHVTISSAAQMITIPNTERRYQIFEQLITKHPDLADPIIRTVVGHHTNSNNKITDLLPLDFEDAPLFYSRVHELLRDNAQNARTPGGYRERILLPDPVNDRPPPRHRPRRGNFFPGR